MGEHHVAWGINASGQVVGTKAQFQTRALPYTDAAGLQDLNTLIDPSLGWVLLAASFPLRSRFRLRQCDVPGCSGTQSFFPPASAIFRFNSSTQFNTTTIFVAYSF